MLLDTDVLIDLALDRHPHAEATAELLDRIEHSTLTAFIAWHTVSNFYYLVSPSRGRTDTRDFIVELTRFVSVVSTGTEALHYAAALPMGTSKTRCRSRRRELAALDISSRETSRTTTAPRSPQSGRSTHSKSFRKGGKATAHTLRTSSWYRKHL